MDLEPRCQALDQNVTPNSCFEKPFKVRRNEARKQNGGYQNIPPGPTSFLRYLFIAGCTNLCNQRNKHLGTRWSRKLDGCEPMRFTDTNLRYDIVLCPQEPLPNPWSRVLVLPLSSFCLKPVFKLSTNNQCSCILHCW
jgi:hypothetical protein